MSGRLSALVRPNPLAATSAVTQSKCYDIRYRSSLRGLKRCPSCGEYSAQRSQLCRNEKCELRRTILASRRPFDPVQLVTHTGALLYSLRAKEQQPQPRNFVQITGVTLALEEHTQSSIVSLDCVCYTDTCKYDANEATGITCKHIKACQSGGHSSSSASQLPKAEVYPIVREVLWNLNIATEQKQRLWDAYKAAEREVPAIQRLSSSTFAVKCAQSKVFPAGRLHVTAVCGNSLMPATGSTSTPVKKNTHACACKKLKIILEPDNSVVMQEEICDHLLLVLAAILSTPHGKTLYGNFTSSLKSFWMPAALETPVGDAASPNEDVFFGLSINIGGSFGGDGSDGAGETAADDIFIFGDEFLTDDNIPDFSDILDLATHTEAASAVVAKSVSNQPSSVLSSTLATPDLLHTGDPNLVSSCCDINEVDDDVDIKFHDVTAATTIAAAAPLDVATDSVATHLELSDCNIELMDQFQLTDQIDLCSESTELFDAGDTLPVAIIALDAPHMLQQEAYFGSGGVGGKSLLKSSAVHIAASLPTLPSAPPPPPLPPIELPTIAVVKKCPANALDSVHNFQQIPRKRALIVNSTQSEDHVDSEDAAAEPSLAYSAWLDYVIECINESVDITQETHVAHSFHVHEEIFAHFSKSFSLGKKRRVPNTTVVVKHGRHKGLIKYAWYFPTASTVRRIFSSKNISLVDERAFECAKDGSFVPFKSPEIVSVFNDTKQTQLRRIYPKPSLYKAHIWFESNNSLHKSGVKLEWLPNAFARSHYGILNIEFSIGVKEPLKL